MSETELVRTLLARAADEGGQFTPPPVEDLQRVSRRSPRALIAVAASVLVVVAVALALPNDSARHHSTPATRTISAASVPSGCIETSNHGRQIWHGGPDTAASKLGEALQHLADKNQDEVSGVAFCSDYSGVVIFVASPRSELLSSIASVQSAYPAVPIYTASVAAGLTAQLTAAKRVVSRFTTDLSEVGPDTYTGGLYVSLSSQVQSSDQLRRQIIAVATSNGSITMPVTFLPNSSVSSDHSSAH